MLLFRIQINFNFLFQLQCDWAQIQVIVLTNDGNGFGFGISGSRNSGAVVRNIFPGGAADRVRKGDILIFNKSHVKNPRHPILL